MTWSMFPNPQEQQWLTEKSAAELSVRLMNSPSVLMAAVHDIVMTLKDEEKAKTILAEAIATFGSETISNVAIEVLLVRILHDDASYDDEKPFLEFCQKNGLKFHFSL